MAKPDRHIMDKFMDERRGEMLTVRKLIEYLQTQNPDACILAYEPNSNAYIEQMDDIPNRNVCRVGDALPLEREWLECAYKDPEEVERNMTELFRYAKADDVIIGF